MGGRGARASTRSDRRFPLFYAVVEVGKGCKDSPSTQLVSYGRVIKLCRRTLSEGVWACAGTYDGIVVFYVRWRTVRSGRRLPSHQRPGTAPGRLGRCFAEELLEANSLCCCQLYCWSLTAGWVCCRARSLLQSMLSSFIPLVSPRPCVAMICQIRQMAAAWRARIRTAYPRMA